MWSEFSHFVGLTFRIMIINQENNEKKVGIWVVLDCFKYTVDSEMFVRT